MSKVNKQYKTDNAKCKMGMSVLVCIALWCVLAPQCVIGESPAALNKKGNEAFSRKQYDQALECYNKAKELAPEIPQILFNIGSALTKQEKVEDATGVFDETLGLAEDDELKSKVYYDKGVLSYRRAEQQESVGNLEEAVKQLEESLDYGKQSLRKNPNDTDAKYNFEQVKKKLELLKAQMQQQEQQQQQQEQNKNDEEQQQKEQEQKQEQQDKQEEQKEQQQESQGDEQQQEQQDEPQQQSGEQQQQKEQEFSKEDAERLLNALLKEDEKEMRRFLQGRISRTLDMENDW